MKPNILILFLMFFSVKAYSKVMHFNWKSSGEGYSYKVQIAKDNKFENIFITETTSNNFFIVDIPPGKYFFRIIPILKKFEGEPSSSVSFEIDGTYDPNRENLKEIYPPEVLDKSIITKDEFLKLKPAFKTKKGNIKYNINDLKNFRAADEVSIYTPALSNGQHTIYFKTSTSTGKESKIKEYSFIIDRKSPELIISARSLKSGQREYIFPDSFIDFGIFDDDPDVKYYIWINGKRIDGKSFFVSRNESFIRCTIFAVDRSGNVSTITKNFYVDINPPKIYINLTNHNSRQIVKGDFLETFYDDETPLLETKIFINGKEYYINRIRLKEIGQGKYEMRVLAIDTFFNTNEKIFNLFITNEESGIKGYIYE